MHDLTVIPGVEPSADLRERYAGQTTLLSFSCGKDSVAAWLAIRDRCPVIPYYCYGVPDLEFVEESLAYYEAFFGTRIRRLPHPSLYRKINNMTFCPPERCAIIEASSLPNFERADLLRGLRTELGQEYPCATGVRAADSIIRRLHFKAHGPINIAENLWYPVWDWRAEKVRSEIKRAGVKIPVDYLMFGRSFDGCDYRFLKQIKTYFPRDYAKILDWFPLAELELKRREFAQAIYV